MERIRLSTLGAWSAIATTVLFVTGGVMMASSGVGTLIPETGASGREWLSDVDSATPVFFAGAWVIILMGYAGVVALVAFYPLLRDAGPVMVLAPVLATVGLTLVTVSHLVPIAMGYELAPAYADAAATDRPSLMVLADTLAATCLVINYAGNALNWGVVVPMYSVAILRTDVLPHWIGWLGLVVAVFAGWLGLIGPASDVVEGLSSIGFVGFFLFMPSMGIAILRRRLPESAEAPAAH